MHAPACAPAQSTLPPTATLDNGPLHVTVYLPDAQRGFYKGTRFDWSGVIGSLTFAGHNFYGPWFNRTDPPVRDFVYSGPQNEIVAGEASSITGPSEEFVSSDGTAIGFASAAPGGTFLKLGVGLLRRPDTAAYDHYRHYDIVDNGSWTVRSSRHSIRFTQTIKDDASGYSYIYRKTLHLLSGKPVLVIEHSLTNTGRLPLDTEVYNHNFLTLDGRPIGPHLSVTLPFPVQPEHPINADLGRIDGDRIRYLRPLAGKDTFTVSIGGFRPDVADNSFRVEDSEAKVGVSVTGDRPLLRESLWSIRSTLAIEPFVHIVAAPGKNVTWSYTYRYYKLPSK